ncbi:MAG: hypothetical protein GY851_31810 [bacterium]|nr:hypothetical protein [bacterium]
MRDDVEQALQAEPIGDGNGGFTAQFVFRPDMPVFQGHFPGNPIVPGVMQLEMVRFCYERVTGGSAHIRRVVKAKYSGKALPGVAIDLAASTAAHADGVLVRASLASSEGPISTIQMVLSLASRC